GPSSAEHQLAAFLAEVPGQRERGEQLAVHREHITLEQRPGPASQVWRPSLMWKPPPGPDGHHTRIGQVRAAGPDRWLTLVHTPGEGVRLA
ncbi:MAG: hypothetical protein AAFS10_19755, partial [Myxococcota bacterium]